MTSEVDNDIILVDNIGKKFGNFIALNNFNLKMQKGIYGLIGPNGAGKSTLIRILLGLTKPTSGKAFIFGFDVEKDSFAVRKRIGCVHEKPVYPKHFETLRYLEKVGRLYNQNSSDPKALLKIVGLSQAAERPIGKLSAGMLQRLGIAQALIGNQKLVILDEPTSNLDVIGRGEILDTLLSIHKTEGVSFFYIFSRYVRIRENLQSCCFYSKWFFD